jgi:hypothetical protein
MRLNTKAKMKHLRFIYVILITVFMLYQSLAGQTIVGQVFEAKTKKPLEAVNIFIVNSTIGTATDQAGIFRLSKLPPGTFVMVVSHIGYKIKKYSIRVTANLSDSISVFLEESPIQMPEIVVTAKELKKRKKYIKKFIEVVIGTSENADKCTLVNPEVLDFNSKRGVLKATAREPIIIENRGLGYRLYYYLSQFEVSKSLILYDGMIRFEELNAYSGEEQDSVLSRRIKAYNGSMKHFFTIFYKGFLENQHKPPEEKSIGIDEALRKHGFEVSALNIYPQLAYRMRAPDLDLGSMIKPGPTETEFWLSGPPPKGKYAQLWISYTLEKVTPAFRKNYAYWRRGRGQRSIISLRADSVLIGKFGNVTNPTLIERAGEWALEQLAEAVPVDFEATPGEPVSGAARPMPQRASRALLQRRLLEQNEKK